MPLRLFHLWTFTSGSFSRLGKMNGAFKPSARRSSAEHGKNVGVDRHFSEGANGGYSSVRGQNSLLDGAEKQTQSWGTSNITYEDEFPLLSSSMNAASKSKRRIRIDLGAQFEQRSEQGPDRVCLPQLETSSGSNSASQPDELNLPTSMGKKHLHFASGGPGLPRTSPRQGTYARNSRDTNCKPFDICLPLNKKQAILRASLLEKDNLKCVQVDYPIVNNGEVLRPGMILFKSYIPIGKQVKMVLRCQQLGLGTGGFYQPGYQDGAKLRLYMMCLGLDWDPQTKKYGKRRHHDSSEPPDIPLDFSLLVRKALQDSHTLIKQQLRRSDVEEILPVMSPDICIVNFYTTNGRLGLHQDRDESSESLNKGLPVVSFSIGDSAEFLYGDQRDVDKAERVLLESGDVLIFGGKSRNIFHGVTSIIPKTAPPALLEYTTLRPGRLNLTFRQY